MRNLNSVHLNGLRAAEAAGRCGSLKAAALELGVSIGAVSQHILRLEAQIGRRIFQRTAGGLRPTAFGTRFLTRLSAAFATLDHAVAEARQRDADLLTISVAPVFAAKWLVPRLGRFSRRYPDTRVRIEATTELVHPDEADIDLAIRVGDGNWPNVRTEFLLAQDVFPVGVPDLVAALQDPREILALPVVQDANSTLTWNLWLHQFGLDEADMVIGNSFTDAALCLDAAIAGQGVMLAWQALAQDAMADGRLVAPFEQRAVTGLGYWIVTSAKHAPSPKIRRFSDWLREELGEPSTLHK